MAEWSVRFFMFQKSRVPRVRPKVPCGPGRAAAKTTFVVRAGRVWELRKVWFLFLGRAAEFRWPLLPERVMNPVSGFASAFAAVALVGASSASASVVTFTQQFVWEFYVTNAGSSIFVEDFNSLADGFYPDPFNATTGPVNWSATAAGGLYVDSGVFSTQSPTALTFSFGAGVQGVGGNFFGTDFAFNVVPTIVTLSLADGTSYVGFVDSNTAFTGFYSNGAAVTSITVSAAALPGGEDVYPSVDNLRFAFIPSPGAIALLGLAGLAGARRRR